MAVPETMRAMVLDGPGQPLRLAEVAVPRPGPGELLLRVHACGVCRTDLHLRDGELDVRPHPPRILGHQIVATPVAAGDGVALEPGAAARIGVPWLGWTDGDCRFCRSGRENLCERAEFTGRDRDGGYAEYVVADERFCLPLPGGFDDLQAAPLLCAGLIGYRSLRFCGDARRLGLYGFGASAHIICQLAVWQGRRVFAFTRRGDERGQAFARELGASWAGAAGDPLPVRLDAAIVFAPAGELVPLALRALDRGGTVVCAGIHMTEIPPLDYDDLWLERSIRSVANLTRRDGEEFLGLAPQVPIRTRVTRYPLEQAEQALTDLRDGRLVGAAVVVP